VNERGGAETIRQNALFKDPYQMIEHPTEKRKAKKALEVIEWYFAAVPQVSKTIGVDVRAKASAVA
jgi:hypothetical protein